MGIQKDAGKLLVYIYDYYTKSQIEGGFMLLNIDDLETSTKWEKPKLYRAIAYLSDLNLIKTHEETLDIIYGMTPEGINTIENKDKFQKSFGFSVNLGIVGFNWGAKEK